MTQLPTDFSSDISIVYSSIYFTYDESLSAFITKYIILENRYLFCKINVLFIIILET